MSLQGTIEVVDHGPRHAQFVVNNIYSFPSLIFGCTVGAFQNLGIEVDFWHRTHSISRNEHFVTWER